MYKNVYKKRDIYATFYIRLFYFQCMYHLLQIIQEPSSMHTIHLRVMELERDIQIILKEML